MKISAEQARWRCNPEDLGFKLTSELSPGYHITGQDEAVDALSYGLENRSKGHNVFVRGLSGFGRMALIDQMIEQVGSDIQPAPDRCYVYNFDSPDKPALISLTPGTAPDFQSEMENFATFAEEELPAYLASDRVKSKQKELTSHTQAQIQEIGSPFDADMKANGLVMVPIQMGQNMVPAILPVFDGKPVQYDALQQMRTSGEMSEEDYKALMEKIAKFEDTFSELGENISTVQLRHQEAMRSLMQDEAFLHISTRIELIKSNIGQQAINPFLEAVVNDLVTHRLFEAKNPDSFSRLYQVNVVRTRKGTASSPVVSLTNPTMSNLVGKIDRDFTANPMTAHSDHLMVKTGALLEADGGYLILETQDLLTEPGAWSTLLRTLKTGVLEISNADPFGLWASPQLKPDPIPIDIKVVLVGDPQTYYLLEQYEPRFADLFKVLADFGDTISREKQGQKSYANVVARLVERDGLLPFSAGAVAELIEHGARICAQANRLTSRFGRVADISREAAFLAKKAAKSSVEAEDVAASIKRSKGRAESPVIRFRRMIASGTLRIQIKGAEVGQINGLAISSAGSLMYGFPSRITASIGPGSAGAVNIERESELSGSVHTKGFLILSGLLRRTLRLEHPMAFSASIAFEQTYGGIDGDSASAAEFCCLISALTGIPINQNLAMTGAVDQKGNILAIGGATEKIEGFYDTCQSLDFTGEQAVLIPASNANELMLRHDVVQSIADGKFAIHTIDTIDEALSLMMGREAGDIDQPEYAKDTILALAQQKAHEFWLSAKKSNKS